MSLLVMTFASVNDILGEFASVRGVKSNEDRVVRNGKGARSRSTVANQVSTIE